MSIQGQTMGKLISNIIIQNIVHLKISQKYFMTNQMLQMDLGNYFMEKIRSKVIGQKDSKRN